MGKIKIVLLFFYFLAFHFYLRPMKNKFLKMFKHNQKKTFHIPVSAAPIEGSNKMFPPIDVIPHRVSKKDLEWAMSQEGFIKHSEYQKHKKQSVGAKFDVKKRDCAGRTILHGAVFFGDVAFVKDLLKKGADANARDYRGNTPAHLVYRTSEKKGLEILNALAAHGAHISEHNNDGDRPLHLVAKKGMLDLVKYFIRNGIFLNYKNKAGKTPYMLAKEAILRSKKCSDYIYNANELQNELVCFVTEIVDFQKKDNIRNLDLSDIAEIKIKMKGKKDSSENKEISLNELIKNYLLEIAKLLGCEDVSAFIKHIAIDKIFEYDLHKKYGVFVSISLIKKVIRTTPFKIFLFYNSEFVRVILDDENLVDSNGLRPYEKLVYSTVALPKIFSGCRDIHKSKDIFRRIFENNLSHSEKKVRLLDFLAKAVCFAKIKKGHRFLDCFKVLMYFDEKLGKFNKEIKKIKEKKKEPSWKNQKYSSALAEHILGYAKYGKV
ncbi:ankyrin repeat domain-containing protein [Candidatus Dependentiae bacterium]